jgi:hypothetical protein
MMAFLPVRRHREGRIALMKSRGLENVESDSKRS